MPNSIQQEFNGFSVTDLINSSNTKGQEKLQSTIDLYKRAVKNEEEMDQEIIIKNYRFRVIKPNRDLNDEQRSLMNLNKGTSIYVANSLIKPEQAGFSTRVNQDLGQLFPIQTFETNKPHSKPLSFQQELYLQTVSHETEQSRQLITSHIVPITEQTDEDTVIMQTAQTGQSSHDISTQIFFQREDQWAEMQSKMKIQKWLNPPDQIIVAQEDEFMRQLFKKQLETERYILSNSQKAPLNTKELAVRMSSHLDQKHQKQQRIVDVEEMCEPYYKDKPYLNLMRTIINPQVRRFMKQYFDETIKFKDRLTLPNQQNQLVQIIDYKHQLQAILLVKREFTHLDPHLLQEANLENLFIEQEYIDSLEQRIINKTGSIMAKIDFLFKNGEDIIPTIIEVEIIAFDQNTRLFTCRNEQLNLETTRVRQNILLDTDNPSFIKFMKERTIKLKAETTQHLRVQRLIQQEMCKKLQVQQLAAQTREIIQKKVGNLLLFQRPSVEKLIIQIEAQFVYAMMHSVLISQKQDPFVKQMLINYKIAIDSPALEIEKQNYIEKQQLNGLQQFHASAIKNNLLKSSIMISNQKYIKLSRLLHDTTFQALNNKCMFITPIPSSVLFNFGGKHYAIKTIQNIENFINNYPVDHAEWISAQKVIQDQFHQLIYHDWAKGIAKNVWSYIKQDFTNLQDECFKESQMDENLLKTFYFVKAFQQNTLHDVFLQGLRQYIRFLLSFAMRDAEIQKSKIISTIQNSDEFRLIQEDQNFKVQKSLINDLSLIKLQYKPFLNLHAEVAMYGKIRNQKFKIITVPDLDTIQKDLVGVTKNLFDATKHIKKCEATIFPQIQLKNYYIAQPDTKNNPKFQQIYKIVNKLLFQCNAGCKKKLLQFKTYMSIYKYQVGGFILDLKKQSFILQNEGLNDDEDIKPIDYQILVSSDCESREQNENSDQELDEDSDDDTVLFGLNNLAFKSVDIDKNLLKEKIELIRNHRYTVMQEISNQYDFGLLYLDCTEFKQSIINHCEQLEAQITEYLKSEFQMQMKSVNQEIQTLKGRLGDEVNTIESVMVLLEYIDTLKLKDNKVEEIACEINVMQDQIEYINSIKIMLPIEMNLAFLHIRNWPRTFAAWTVNRQNELLFQKAQLIEAMQIEINDVFWQMQKHRQILLELSQKGLKKRKVIKETKQNNSDDIGKSMIICTLPGILQTHAIIFEWLCQEIQLFAYQFDCELIDETFQKLVILKEQVEQLYLQISFINKRLLLLKRDQLDFSENDKILEQIKPLHMLKMIAKQFKEHFQLWFEQPIEYLEYSLLETLTDEWTIELKRLQKNQFIIQNVKQIQLLNFILDCLAYCKKYWPLIKLIRVKGLTQRHWEQLNQELKVSINPKSSSLLQLISLQLWKPDKIFVIKKVSDLAQKEFAIQMQSDELEIELKVIEFLFRSSYKRLIIWQIEETINKYSELLLRLSIIKMSPFAKQFLVKLIEFERICQCALEIIIEYELLQKKWLYLQNILGQNCDCESLEQTIQQWIEIDRFFEKTVLSMNEQPQVYKLTFKEGLLASIRYNINECDECKTSLLRYLESKRQLFPRLYFLSDKNLLSLYSKQTIELLVSANSNTFITRLYNGIDKLLFKPNTLEIIGFQAKDGEQLYLPVSVSIQGPVDRWLTQFEKYLALAIKKLIIFSYQDMDRDLPNIPEEKNELNIFKHSNNFLIRNVKYNAVQLWVESWPGQCANVALQLWFTKKIETMFMGALERKKENGINHNILLARGYELSDESDEYKSVQQLSEHTSDQEILFVVNNSQESQEESTSEQLKEEKLNTQTSAFEFQKTKSKLPVFDRIMRNWDRFQVNEVEHPHKQLLQIKSGIVQKIGAMVEYLQRNINAQKRNSCLICITQSIFQRDQTQSIMINKNFKVTDFDWQIQFKFHFSQLKKVFANITNSAFEKKPQQEWHLDLYQGSIQMDVLNISIDYGYEYAGNFQKIIITPLTLRAQRSMLVALNYKFAVSIQGPLGTGKTETVKDLAYLLGRAIITTNSIIEFDYNEICKLMKGVTSSGLWVFFDEFNRFKLEQMNFFSSLISCLQNAIRSLMSYFIFDHEKVKLERDVAIFIASNPFCTNKVEMPLNLKQQFRIITLVQPDTQLIIESLLLMSGFTTTFASKLNYLNKTLQKNRGLIAIRQIIIQAEGYLRQSQNTEEIVVDKAINPEISQMIIQDILDELNEKQGPLFKKDQTNFSPAPQPNQKFSNFMEIPVSQQKSLFQQLKSAQELEEEIIIRAVIDFKESVFLTNQQPSIQQLIEDVFNTKNHQTGYPCQLFKQNMQHNGLNENLSMEQKCEQFHKIIQVKMGCIIYGQSMSGKSTLIETVSGGLNMASQSELKTRIAQERKERLRNSLLSCPQLPLLIPSETYNILKPKKQELLSPTLQSSRQSHNSGQSKQKLSFSQKQKNAIWQDLFHKTRLNQSEINKLTQELNKKGVKINRINPMTISKQDLIGHVDQESGLWHEGMLTQILRDFSKDFSSQKKWVHIDGPVNYEWVENLNSILDLKRVLNLPNGDIIEIPKTVCLLFETDCIQNLTPSTISRCGLIHLDRSSLVNTKAMINNYLQRLPPQLKDNIIEIEAQINYLIPICIQQFKSENQSFQVDEFWLIQQFIKVLDSFMSPYWIDFIVANKSDYKEISQQNALRQCLKAFNLQEEIDSEEVIDPQKLEFQFKQMRIQNYSINQRLSNNDILSSEIRVENSLKFIPQWCEAFIITAISATFGAAMTSKARESLSNEIKKKMNERKSDFASYQKTKKKRQQASEEKRQQFKKKLKTSSVLSEKITGQSSISVNSQSHELSKDYTESNNKAVFITDFPQNKTIFDYYYNFDTNTWSQFEQPKYNHLQNHNLTIMTPTLLSSLYNMECSIFSKLPVLVCGPNGVGKSWLVKQFIFKQVNEFSSNIVVDVFTCSYRSTASTFKDYIVGHFHDDSEQQKPNDILTPPEKNNLLIFVEDLHLSQMDKFSVSSLSENLREIIHQKEWQQNQTTKQVENINFIASITEPNISTRILRHFQVVKLEGLDHEQEIIINKLFEIGGLDWNKKVIDQIPNITNALLALYDYCYQELRPTPQKVQYQFDQREIYKIVNSFCRIKTNYLQNTKQISELFFHETIRQFGDRIQNTSDHEMLINQVKKICVKYFEVIPEIKYFSFLNEDSEEQYSEIININSTTIRQMIQNRIMRYNDQQSQKLNIVLCDQIITNLMKIMRAISYNGAHLVIIGLRGYATGELIKLASFIQQQIYSPFQINPDYSDKDWLNQLFNYLVATGQDDKEICVVIDEQKMLNLQWYREIENLIRCNQDTSVLSQKNKQIILNAIKIQRSVTQKRTSNYIPDNTEGSNEVYSIFLQRVQKNLHFVLTFSPNNPCFRQNLPSQLLNCCQVLWIQNLQIDSLQQIGQQFFINKMNDNMLSELIQDKERDVRLDQIIRQSYELENTQISNTLIQIYIETLEFAKQYSSDTKHVLYYTPAILFKLFNNYNRLKDDIQSQQLSKESQYQNAQQKIQSTLDLSHKYKTDLELKFNCLLEQQKQIIGIMVDIQKRSNDLEAEKQQCIQELSEIQQNINQTTKIYNMSQIALDGIIPSLNQTINQIKQISKYELAEIHSMQNPPKMVKLVMKCVCLLLDVPPVLKKYTNGTYNLSYWRAAISDKVLGHPNIVSKMENFERSNLTDEKMDLIELVIADPEYCQQSAKNACQAIEGIFLWVKAIRDYFYIFKQLQPRKNDLIVAQYNLEQAQQQGVDKLNYLKQIDQEINHLNDIRVSKQRFLDEIDNQIQDFICRKKRLKDLKNALMTEQQKYVVKIRDVCRQNLKGQGILASAIVTFAGAFTFNFRRQLIDIWIQKAPEVNKDIQLQDIFLDHFKIREWHANKLPKDLLSTDNALIMAKSDNYSLFIDPQQQALQWLKHQHTEMQYTQLTDPNFKKTIEIAIQTGVLVMVHNMTEKYDIILESLIKRDIARYGDISMINFCRKKLLFNNNFSLVMLTNVAKPCFDVNLTNYVTLINFNISLEGLSSKLLSLIIDNKKPEIKYNEAVELLFDQIQNLKKIETTILDNLNVAISEILSNQLLIEQLKESRSSAECLSHQIRTVSQFSHDLEQHKIQYTPVAFRCATIFQAILDLPRLNLMYQYTLKWFLNEFIIILKEIGKLDGKQFEIEIGKQSYIINGSKIEQNTRILNLQKSLTQEFIKKVRNSVFQEDQQVVTYFLALRILEAEQLSDSSLIKFVLNESDINKLQTFVPFSKLDYEYIKSTKTIDLAKTNIDLSQFDVKSQQPIPILKEQTERATTANVYTEQQILQDESLWNLSDVDLSNYSEEEEEQFQQNEQNINALRQTVLKFTVELALAKCLRPDLVQSSLDKMISTIYDFDYQSIQDDFFIKNIDIQATKKIRKTQGLDQQFYVPQKEKIYRSNYNVLEEAYYEASNQVPTLFFMSENFSIQHELYQLYLRQPFLNFRYIQCCKSEENKFHELLAQGMKNGDQILIENIQNEPQWIDYIEHILEDMEKSHKKFRLWITTHRINECSSLVLKTSKKVGLQQPKTIQTKILQKLSNYKDEKFKKNNPGFADLYKNLYFALHYLCAVLQEVFEFQQSDYIICNETINSYFKLKLNRTEMLELIKYVICEVNLGANKSFEDKRKLNCFANDLFNQKLAFCSESQSDTTHSHFGFPNRDQDFYSFVSQHLPESDGYEIFGYNQAIWRQKQAKISKFITNEICILNQIEPSQFNFLQNPLVALINQLLCTKSSYQHNIANEAENDKLQRQITNQIIMTLKQLSFPKILPEDDPLMRYIAYEFSNFDYLLKEIIKTFEQFLFHLSGRCLMPQPIETIWLQILKNQIPKTWSSNVSKTLIDYFQDFEQKIEYWSQFNKDIPVYNLNLYNQPELLLEAQIQKKARQNIPIENLRHKISITKWMNRSEIEFEKLEIFKKEISILVSGMWLEGAEWNNEILQNSENLRNTFPLVLVELISELKQDQDLFQCPVFTNDRQELFVVEMKSAERPQKWVKQSVSLLII